MLQSRDPSITLLPMPRPIEARGLRGFSARLRGLSSQYRRYVRLIYPAAARITGWGHAPTRCAKQTGDEDVHEIRDCAWRRCPPDRDAWIGGQRPEQHPRL